MNSLGTIWVHKIYILQLYLPSDGSRPILSRRLPFLVCFEDIKETFGVDQGIIDCIVYAVQLTYRCRNIVEEHDMKHNCTQSHLLIHHEIGRKDNYDDHPDLLDKPFDTVKEKTCLAGSHLVFG